MGDRYKVSDRPIRICQLITELEPAGAERVVCELATRLDKSRFNVQVAALRGGLVARRLAEAGVKVTVLGVRHKMNVGKVFTLARLLREERIDLLHTHLFHADLAGRAAAALAGTRHLVHTVHVAEARWRPWQYAFARLAVGRCDRIVCVSRAVMEHHAKRTGLAAERYQVIYNGIDCAAYERRPAWRDEMRRRWGVGEENVVIAFVGRLNVQKNVGLFLDVAGRLHQTDGRVRAVLAGDGPERNVVEGFLARADNASWCRWLGRVENIPAVLSGVDLLIQPSRWEGFGLSAAEAMAAGVPVVATRVPGLSEVVEDGVSGLLAASEDGDAMVAAAKRLMAEPALRSSLIAAAKARVAEQFSIERNISAHEQLYSDILNIPNA